MQYNFVMKLENEINTAQRQFMGIVYFSGLIFTYDFRFIKHYFTPRFVVIF